MKQFNTTAVCIPSKHYMVDLSERVKEIKKLVDAGKYFTINRARQYGKTTTLSAIRKALEKTYNVASISFEKISSAGFATEESFVKALRLKKGRSAENGRSSFRLVLFIAFPAQPFQSGQRSVHKPPLPVPGQQSSLSHSRVRPG